MIEATFEAIKPRHSLLALAGAAEAGSGTGLAADAGKKARKRARQRCQLQVTRCEAVISARCADGGDDCLDFALPCCALLATCDVNAALECMFFRT